MSLLDSIAEKATATVKANAGGWVEKAVAAGQSQVASAPVQIRAPALAALSVMGDNAEVLGSTTGEVFALLVAHLALGNEQAAELAWLASAATYEQRMAALDAAREATEADARAKEAAWQDVRDVALRVLVAAGKAALPLLLAAI